MNNGIPETTCRECEGLGWLSGNACARCEGTGEVVPWAAGVTARSRDYRARKPEQAREQFRKDTAKRYAQLRVWLAAFKAQIGCQECGETESVCLEFHHLDPEQKLLRMSPSWSLGGERLLAEMRGCLLLCSNCHRKATHGKIDVSHLAPPDYECAWVRVAHLRQRLKVA